MLLYFIAYFVLLDTSEVEGLKITKLSVPDVLDIRNSAVFTCDFDLEKSKLYSVKWYKDELEFCRFMPNIVPNVQVFEVAGLHLNKCNMTHVVLSPLEYSSSGLYTCELSAEAPFFHSVQSSANITVLGIPQKDPVAGGVRPVYAVGDYVEANCTSDPSWPPSDLEWYVNGNRAESWQVDRYPPAEEGGEGEGGLGLGLRRSTLGLNFQVDHSHFPGRGNTMILACVANLGAISRQTSLVVKLADLDLEKSAQGLYGNGCGTLVASRGPTSSCLAIATMVMRTMWT